MMPKHYVTGPKNSRGPETGSAVTGKLLPKTPDLDGKFYRQLAFGGLNRKGGE